MNQNKAKILEAASTLFLKGGPGALSVRAIAKEAGVSTIGIYSHFEGKQGILDALYIEGFGYVVAAMDVLTLGLVPRDAVLLASKNYLQLAETHEAHYRLIFGENNGAYAPSKAAKSVAIKAFKGLTDLVANAYPALADDAARVRVALQVWALMHGSVSLKQHAVGELVGMGDWQSRALEAVAVFIDGLSSGGASG
jgi:AcrR family transcriptional regulator